MKSLRIEIDSDIHTDLKLLAIKEGTTVSELIRDLIVGAVGSPRISTPELKQPMENKKYNKVYEAIVCKNGHILNQFGRCMQKGCKYA